MRINIDRERVNILLFLDFKKAFDSVDVSTLCKKLKLQFKFSSSACNLMFSYLSCRSFVVRVGENVSIPYEISSGVPQGSLLGPLLFSMYINDLPNVASVASVLMYADDVALLVSSKLSDLNDCIRNLNRELIAISDWAEANAMVINNSKTQAIAVYKREVEMSNYEPILLNGLPVQFAKKVKYLGIMLNVRLKWDDHVNTICSKVYFMLRRLNTVNQFLPKWLRNRLVKLLIVPHITYGCEIFFNCSATNKRKLELCYNAAVRYVHALRKFDHISHLSKDIFGMTLFKYFEFRCLQFMYKIVKFQRPEYIFNLLIFSRFSRTNNLGIPRHRTAYMSDSFQCAVPLLWNAIPVKIRRSVAFGSFSKQLYTHFCII